MKYNYHKLRLIEKAICADSFRVASLTQQRNALALSKRQATSGNNPLH
jgi:hypothetical protein